MAKEKRIMENFSREDEERIRGFLFTNPHGEDSFVYPQPLVAGEELSPLMSAVSRTHLPMQTRVLQFLDQEKAEQTKAMLPYINPLIDVFRLPDGTLKISRKTGNFNKEWVLAHGHGSVKEGTVVFGHSENIADITGKKITGHPVIHPQVKSTRYISYGKVLNLSENDEDLQALPEPSRFHHYQAFMNQRYLEFTEKLADKVFGTGETKELVNYFRQPQMIEVQLERWITGKRKIDHDFNPSEEEKGKQRASIYKGLEDESVRKDIGKFVLDSSRVYLTAATKTSLVFSSDARTLEEVITDLISSPRKEDQRRGNQLWQEAEKIAPVLLGEKSHVKIDEWKVKNETELRGYLQERFGNIEPKNHGNMVNVLSPQKIEMYTDRFNAALTVFPYVDAALQDIMSTLKDSDVKEILHKAHEHRGPYDVIHPAISHGGLMHEIVMGYHGYRDIFRHRRGSRSVQLLTTRLGFEQLEIFKIFGMDKEYAQDMQFAAGMYEKARSNPHAAEKLVPFGALCRSLHSWQVNQVGYMGRLRGDIATGNLSYVLMAREMIDEVSKLMPETAKYFKVDRRNYPAGLWKKGYEWFDSLKSA